MGTCEVDAGKHLVPLLVYVAYSEQGMAPEIVNCNIERHMKEMTMSRLRDKPLLCDCNGLNHAN